jgi:uncharacterized protein (TIGR02231 family)
MKKQTLLLLVLPLAIFAQSDTATQTRIQATLTNATVYYGGGAELNHTATVPLAPGFQNITISGVATRADANTVQVVCPNGVTLLSQRFSTITLPAQAPERDALYYRMEDTLKLLNRQVVLIDNDITTSQAVLARIGKLLDATIGTSGKDISSDQIIKLADYYQAKLEASNKKVLDYAEKKEDLQEEIALLKKRMEDRTSRQPQTAKTAGQLVLQVKSETTGPADFAFTYFTPNAGWMAAYDLRVSNADNRFKLGYRAGVFQSTGLPWKRAKLTLSTGSPASSTTMPILPVWRLYPQALALAKSYGRSKQAADTHQMDAALHEVVVTGYAANRLDEEKAESSSYVDQYLNLSESQLNTSFAIDLPYDVPADGQQHTVAIKEELISPVYEHFAVPKIDKDAFLLAKISNWQNLNLLPGNANVSIDNVYLGSTIIDPNSIADTLSVSLGRDKRVSITRSALKDLTKVKMLGDNKSESRQYELVVRNNKKQPVQLVLKDQYPVSANNAIETKLDESGGADINKETGEMIWQLTLQPGESKKLRFGYTIKYPKSMTIR